MRNFYQKHKGFTLFELIMIIILIAAFAIIVVPRLTGVSDAAKESIHQSNIDIINTQVERWYIEKGDFPMDDLSDIGADNDYFPDGIPNNPIDDSDYELDPITHRVQTN